LPSSSKKPKTKTAAKPKTKTVAKPKTKTVAKVSSESEAEAQLAQAFTDAGLTGWVQQYRYVKGRKHRADFAFPEQRLIVEVDGGVYNRKAHGSISGILRDMERSNLAAVNGYRVMRYTPSVIKSKKQLEKLIEQVKEALNGIQDTG